MPETVESLIRQAIQTLTVPAAEYCPAIPDAWTILERALRLASPPPQATWAPQWLPIESAPKDGTRVLAYREDWIDCYAVAWWSKGSGEWECSGSQFRQASHWMPIPEGQT